MKLQSSHIDSILLSKGRVPHDHSSDSTGANNYTGMHVHIVFLLLSFPSLMYMSSLSLSSFLPLSLSPSLSLSLTLALSSDDFSLYYLSLDSIVNEALKKSRRDQSVMMATALKEMVAKTDTDKDTMKTLEETDAGRVTREVNQHNTTCIDHQTRSPLCIVYRLTRIL